MSVSKYKSLKRVKSCNIYLFYNGVLSSLKQFRIYYVLAVVRSQFNIINNNNNITVCVSKYKTLNNIKCL